MNKKQKDLCNRFYDEVEIDLAYIMDKSLNDSVPDTINELLETLQERVYEIECIYYSNAMEYLQKNDPSLQYSTELANEMGYTTENINSELLATLLQQQEAQTAIYEYQDELQEVFNLD